MKKFCEWLAVCGLTGISLLAFALFLLLPFALIYFAICGLSEGNFLQTIIFVTVIFVLYFVSISKLDYKFSVKKGSSIHPVKEAKA